MALILFLLGCDGGKSGSNTVYYEVSDDRERLLFLIIDPDRGWTIPQRGCCSYKVSFDINGVAFINDAKFLEEWHKSVPLSRTGEAIPAGYRVHVLRAAQDYAIIFYGDIRNSQSYLNQFSDFDFMGLKDIHSYLIKEGLLMNENAEYLRRQPRLSSVTALDDLNKTSVVDTITLHALGCAGGDPGLRSSAVLRGGGLAPPRVFEQCEPLRG